LNSLFQKPARPSVQTSEQIEIRIYNPHVEPTLIYLPGLHGDWTLIGGFRRALGSRARFVEVVYPRTLTWSLEQYAQAIETALERHGISHGWLLGESFGSQLVWALAGSYLRAGLCVIPCLGPCRSQNGSLATSRTRCCPALPSFTRNCFVFATGAPRTCWRQLRSFLEGAPTWTGAQ